MQLNIVQPDVSGRAQLLLPNVECRVTQLGAKWWRQIQRDIARSRRCSSTLATELNMQRQCGKLRRAVAIGSQVNAEHISIDAQLF